MEGTQQAQSARPLRLPASVETVVISYSETARLTVPAVARAFERQGLKCRFDEKSGDPADAVSPLTLKSIQESAMLCIVLGRRCRQTGWHDREAAVAKAAGQPVLVFVESLLVEWHGQVVPTLLTDDATRLSAFIANSRPDTMSLWEFGMQFFVDRRTAGLFRRASVTAWRWRRETEHTKANSDEPGFEITFADETVAVSPEVSLVEARVENGLPVLMLGMNDGTRYRLAYSPDIRAVLPAPVFPGSPMIGFMHSDFDSGREWPRAGDAPVELRLLGREVYGWHMSEYFWRAFVGSLPKMLGQGR